MGACFGRALYEDVRDDILRGIKVSPAQRDRMQLHHDVANPSQQSDKVNTLPLKADGIIRSSRHGWATNSITRRLIQTELIQAIMPHYYVDEELSYTDKKLALSSWNLILKNHAPAYVTSKTKSLQSSDIVGGEAIVAVDAAALGEEASAIAMFYNLFYKRLFEVHPRSKALFSAGLRGQGRHLVRMISHCLDLLDDQEKFERSLKKLITAHNDRDVKAYEYGIMGEVLFWALEKTLLEEFTPQVRVAWVKVYSRMLSVIVPLALQASVASKRRHAHQRNVNVVFPTSAAAARQEGKKQDRSPSMVWLADVSRRVFLSSRPKVLPESDIVPRISNTTSRRQQEQFSANCDTPFFSGACSAESSMRCELTPLHTLSAFSYDSPSKPSASFVQITPVASKSCSMAPHLSPSVTSRPPELASSNDQLLSPRVLESTSVGYGGIRGGAQSPLSFTDSMGVRNPPQHMIRGTTSTPHALQVEAKEQVDDLLVPASAVVNRHRRPAVPQPLLVTPCKDDGQYATTYLIDGGRTSLASIPEAITSSSHAILHESSSEQKTHCSINGTTSVMPDVILPPSTKGITEEEYVASSSSSSCVLRGDDITSVTATNG